MHLLLRTVTTTLLLAALAGLSSAAVFTDDQGTWPSDWGQELEKLRGASRTIGVATGTQENIYEIPIPDRATFDRVWPEVLKVLTPGARISLLRVSDSAHPAWGDLLNGKRPTIRIYAPTGGYALDPEIDALSQPDYEALLKEGKALRATAPWPAEIVGESGTLPEYVNAMADKDGRMKWLSAGDPFAPDTQRFHGFYHRARIDVELVVDGEMIDLNEVRLPDGATIREQRYESPQ